MKRFSAIIATLVIATSVVVPFQASAQVRDPGCVTDIRKTGDPTICLAVPFGNVKEVSNISEYIGKFYDFSIGAILSLAIFMIVIGGVQWVFAVGNPSKISKAKSTIGSAFWAVILAFISVGMLRIINPDLISLKLPEVQQVETIGYYGAQACEKLPAGAKVKLHDGTIIEIHSSPPYTGMTNPFDCNTKYPVTTGGTGAECVGTACYDPVVNEEGTCSQSGCLYGSVLFGSINWVGGYYVEDHMRLVAICESSGNLTTDQTQSYNRDIGSQKRFYSFAIDKSEMTKALINPVFGQCFNKTLKGYLLGVQINDASEPLLPTIDDDVLLNKECNKFIVDGNDPKKLVDFTKDGSLIPPGTPVWTAAELLSKPIECNIEINGASANYSGSQVVTGPPASKGNMTFQSGIINQWNLNHQTQSLQDFLNLIVPKQSIVVKSISDNNFIAGSCEPWLQPGTGPNQERFSQSDPTNDCHHMKGSSHYGGSLLRSQQTTGGKNGRGVENFGQINFACGADIGPVDNDTYAQLYKTIQEVDSASHPGVRYEYFCENTSGRETACPNFKDGEAKTQTGVDHIHLSAHGVNDSCYSNALGGISR